MSIKNFDWSKTSFKFIAQGFICWFFTYVFYIFYISTTWYLYLSLGVIANFLWSIYKSDIHIWFPRNIVEGSGKVPGCMIELFIINWLSCCKAFISRFSCLLYFIFDLISEENIHKSGYSFIKIFISPSNLFLDILVSRFSHEIQVFDRGVINVC